VSRRNRNRGRDVALPNAPPETREGETTSEVVQRAQSWVNEQRQQEFRRDLQELLASHAFRRWAGATLWSKCFGPLIWRPGAEIQKFAARHDLGKEITAEMWQVDPEAYLLLEKEQLTRTADDRTLLRETIARFSKSNDTEGDTDGRQ
jgi:hypothetical protein